MPKVSIILPIYNVEQYLDEALTSVCRQTLRDIEIICVNDGSKDSSPDIIKKYAAKDERIVVLDGPNGGYGKAMNRGIDAATGEYIGILEPDDYLPLDMMEDLYSIAKKNDLDIVKADFYRFGTNSNGDVNMSYNHLDRSGERYGELIDPSHDPSVVKFIMNTWSGIYRRAFLEEFHIRHNETPGASFLSIISQPENAAIEEGGNAALSVTAVGGKEPYTYQWSKDGTAISGASSASYTATAAGANDCQVKDGGGETLEHNTGQYKKTDPEGKRICKRKDEESASFWRWRSCF